MLSPPVRAKATSKRKVSKKSDTVSTSEAPPHATPTQEKQEPVQQTPQSPEPQFLSVQIVATQEAEFYYWEDDKGFLPQGPVTAQVIQSEDSVFDYVLVVKNDDRSILKHKITSDMNQRWSHHMMSLTWNYFGEDGAPRSCLLHFLNQTDFRRMMEIITKCLWEFLHQEEWRKAKVRQIVHGSFGI